MGNKWTIRGREITEDDVRLIRKITEKHFHKGRKYISRQICHQWKRYQPNGQTKDMVCRYILLFLEEKKLISLPPGLHSGNNKKREPEKIKLNEIPLAGRVGDFPTPRLQLLMKSDEYKLWNRIIYTYH